MMNYFGWMNLEKDNKILFIKKQLKVKILNNKLMLKTLIEQKRKKMMMMIYKINLK